MRISTIAGAAIYLVVGNGCSGELAERPAANDPTNAASAEAPFKRPPAYEPDPLLGPVTPKGAENIYSCPMHPDVRSTQAGSCPKCGMTLVPGGHAGDRP